MTNTSPTLCPTRSKKATLGTNPISLAAPAKNGDSLVLGMKVLNVFLSVNDNTYIFI